MAYNLPSKALKNKTVLMCTNSKNGMISEVQGIGVVKARVTGKGLILAVGFELNSE